MWVKVGNDYLNLEHITRVRFSRGWKNGQEEVIAEVEKVVEGAIQGLTRYRGRDAELLQATLGHCSVGDHLEVVATVESVPPPPVGGTTGSDTLHEI